MSARIIQIWIVVLLHAAASSSAFAQTAPLTISSNNTPSDRAALEMLSREAFRRAGAAFRLVSLPSERSLYEADRGEVDGEGLRVAGLSGQYPGLIQVPERYIGISFVAFARDPGIRMDLGWESLAPFRVVYINGWKLFEANAGRARIATTVKDAEQMFRMLDAGRADLALYTLTDGIALSTRMGLTSIVPLSPTLKDVDMYLYLNAKHAALVPRLALALRTMKADGTHQRILNSLSWP